MKIPDIPGVTGPIHKNRENGYTEPGPIRQSLRIINNDIQQQIANGLVNTYVQLRDPLKKNPKIEKIKPTEAELAKKETKRKKRIELAKRTVKGLGGFLSRVLSNKKNTYLNLPDKGETVQTVDGTWRPVEDKNE